jgi:hypothetical protein
MGHPGSLGLLVLYDSAIGPLAQARNKAEQEEEEELADHTLRRVTIERRKKRLRSSTKRKKITRSIQKRCKNIKSGFAVSAY